MSRYIRRTSGQQLLPSRRAEPAGAGAQRPRKFSYERLMQVSVRHSYYNAARGECADFDISPTPTTAVLMRDLGLLYRYEGAGFSVLYDETRKDVLLNYLARQRVPDAASPRAGQ